MEKQQLIEYLDAVCDAESAVQACEDAIHTFQSEKGRMPALSLPSQPVKERIDPSSFSNDGSAKRIGITTAVVTFVIIGMSGLWSSLPGIAPLLIVAAAGIAAWYVSKNKILAEKQENAQRTINEQYKAAYREYEERTAAHYKAVEAAHATTAMIDLAIQKQKNIQIQARTQLERLYAQEIIYPSFQNLIAVYQIREYLKMGICEVLDGPNGAYSQYMNDVRTARICDSIHDLKRSLTFAIHGLQSTLINELQLVDDNLNSIRREINSNMSQLATQMEQIHNSTASQLNARFNETNRYLESMEQNIAISAHNQYVEQRLRDVDAYLLKMPVSH